MVSEDKNKTESEQDNLKPKELNQLQVFIGKWHSEGKSYAGEQEKDNPYASAVPWTSDESYEWLSGDFFVLHKWNAMAGKQKFIGTEIIGFDNSTGKYFTYFFDNAGFHPIYKASVKANIWKFTEHNTRAKVTINDSNTITFNWEWRKTGDAWLPLCDRIAKRIA